ncbi:MAG: M15 family metallopeptidase [Cyanobacteria bacterium P01_F01_bin.3]
MANFADDIPEARRETLVVKAEPVAARSSSLPMAFWLLVPTVAVGIIGAGIWWLKPNASVIDASEPSPSTVGSAVAAETSEPTLAANPSTALPESADAEPSLLGHRAYEIADPATLVAVGGNPMVKLQPEVAQKVETMLAEAQASGVSLGAISGFRTLEDQQYLFFELKAERGQTAETRAEVSAPPGYSEHHTGYAVDFVDLSQPATELNESFEQTPAFRWLEENAPYYGFEMSFPKGNNQNVAYEPWHWRYVGNQESLELFYQDNN